MVAARPAAGATVELRHVSKHYERDASGAAVVDLSLTVAPGEICVLVGPSGCGKTTTLKMVNRLVEPTSGQILIDGQDIAKIEATELRRRIGYVIQQTGLFPHRTIAQNVATVPQLLGWPGERIRGRVDELLALVGLDPNRVRHRYPSQLSGGERQRVGVARAMAAEPPVMLMDEPFGAVDPIVRERLQDEFLRIHHELRTTVLFVTHDIDEAIKMGDRVAVMERGGVLAQYAPPTELLLRPASDFVARFVGADRGLKRLSLSAVGDLDLAPVIVTREGAPVAEARGRAAVTPSAYVCVVDADQRPLGLFSADTLPLDGVPRMGDDRSLVHVDHDADAREALSILLAAGADAAIVIGSEGRIEGVVTLDSIASLFRARLCHRARNERRVGHDAYWGRP